MFPLGIPPPLLTRHARLGLAGRTVSYPITSRRGGRWAASGGGRKPLTEHEKTGHLSVEKETEAILFINNLFPLRLSSLLRRLWYTDRDLADLLYKFKNKSPSRFRFMDPISLVKAAIPESVPITVTDIIPRLRDGGAFVKFRHLPNLPAGAIEEAISKQLREQPLRPWFSPFRGIEVGLVRGTPWLEELHRNPRSRIKAEFVFGAESGGGGGAASAPVPAPAAAAASAAAAATSEETLYELFNRYGKLSDIVLQQVDPKPSSPPYALLDFDLVRDAIMARNCLHGFDVAAGVRLRLSHEQRRRPWTFWVWITAHPRVVIPILAALLAATTFVVLDPIRKFFVKMHISQTYRISSSKLAQWFRTRTDDVLTSLGGSGRATADSAAAAALHAVWADRRGLVETVRTWLLESADTFIVVRGPQDSGRRELVLDEALRSPRPNMLVLDCNAVVGGRGETGTISRLAAAVGYRPVFSWVNSISSLIELTIQGTTGVRYGFSETLESQVVKILQITEAALREVSLAGRGRQDLADDAYLKAHPERRAVVVIDNFLPSGSSSSPSAVVYDRVAVWAGDLVRNNVAHAIFLTDEDPAYSKALSRVQPGRVLRQISLGDLSPEIAKRFIVTRLGEDGGGGGAAAVVAAAASAAPAPGSAASTREGDRSASKPDLSQLDECVAVVGGRLTDLEALARRLRNGQDPRQAAAEMVEQAAAEIVRIFLHSGPSGAGTAGDSDSSSASARKWSPQQAWHLIKALADNPSIPYRAVLRHPIFEKSVTSPAADAEAALASLADAELISVSTRRGRPQDIGPGRPTYRAAFALLVGDAAERDDMDYAVLEELSRIEARTAKKIEAELAAEMGLIRELPGSWRVESSQRAYSLFKKVREVHRRIAELEEHMGKLEMGKLKKRLAEVSSAPWWA